MGVVQRGRSSGGPGHTRSSVSGFSGLSAGMDQSSLLRAPARSGAAANHAVRAFRLVLFLTLPLGAPLSLHALRRLADQAPQSPDLSLLLWRSADRIGYRRLPAVEFPLIRD